MRDVVKQALTRTIVRKGPRGKQWIIAIPPNPKLVLGVKFAVAMTVCLTVLEVAHMALLGKWNSEVFAAITGLSGTVIGIFVGQKA
jgi:hypothetical protein